MKHLVYYIPFLHQVRIFHVFASAHTLSQIKLHYHYILKTNMTYKQNPETEIQFFSWTTWWARCIWYVNQNATSQLDN